MQLECECKYYNIVFDDFRTLLLQNGAQYIGRHFEHNSVWDTASEELFLAKTLLRVRTQIWPDKEKHILTLKTGGVCDSGCKIREERELSLGDAAEMEGIFEKLGYVCSMQYEKIREVWKLPGLEIVLDTLPFTAVVELEGSIEQIELYENIFSLERTSASSMNYHELYNMWLAERGLPPRRGFLFTDVERHELVSQIRGESC